MEKAAGCCLRGQSCISEAALESSDPADPFLERGKVEAGAGGFHRVTKCYLITLVI